MVQIYFVNRGSVRELTVRYVHFTVCRHVNILQIQMLQMNRTYTHFSTRQMDILTYAVAVRAFLEPRAANYNYKQG